MSQTTKALMTTNDTTVTEDERQQAIDYAVEQAILRRVHPRRIDREMHRLGECNGKKCGRAFNGMNLDGVDCR